MASDFVFNDNSEMVKQALDEAILRALERCGKEAEGYAKGLVPSPGRTGTSNLKNSISHKVDSKEQAVYIGTDVEYAAYVELGTGEHYRGGRKTPWVYQDAKGNWYRTTGQKAQPYLKPAVADHAQTYRNIFKDELKNG